MRRLLQPIGDRILVWRIDEGEMTPGGVVIPETARDVPSRGVVLAVGNGKILDSGTKLVLDVAVGEMVLFGKFQGTEMELDGQEYLMLREDDVLAVVEG